MQAELKKRKLWPKVLLVTGIVLVVLVAAGAYGLHRLRQRFSPQAMLDIRAGLGARGIKDADARFAKYLELRYGPQTNPTNREKAFVDFFNPEHIRTLQLMVKHSPEGMRKPNIAATARWVAGFRESLTPDQLADLSARLQAGGGNSMLAQATALYNSQDVHYRSETVPVISELLKTVAAAQNR